MDGLHTGEFSSLQPITSKVLAADDEIKSEFNKILEIFPILSIRFLLTKSCKFDHSYTNAEGLYEIVCSSDWPNINVEVIILLKSSISTKVDFEIDLN